MKKFLLMSALITASATAFANNTTGGFYVGAMPSYLSYYERDNFPVLGTVITRTHGMAATVFGGYQFGRYFALETSAGVWHSPDFVKSDVLAISADMKGIIPIEQKYDIYGKFGLNYMTDFTSRGGTILFGLGGDYKINPNWSVGPQITKNWAPSFAGYAEFSMYSVAVTYSF